MAYLGLDSGTGEPKLLVHGATDLGGGVIHVPNPIIELGRLSELSVTGTVPAPGPGSWEAPELHVTILGGTPVLWWLSMDIYGRAVLNHAIRTGEGSWNDQPLGRVALTTLGEPQAAIRDALAMIEARYRSVVSLVGQQPPSLRPRPGLGLNPALGVVGR